MILAGADINRWLTYGHITKQEIMADTSESASSTLATPSGPLHQPWQTCSTPLIFLKYPWYPFSTLCTPAAPILPLQHLLYPCITLVSLYSTLFCSTLFCSIPSTTAAVQLPCTRKVPLQHHCGNPEAHVSAPATPQKYHCSTIREAETLSKIFLKLALFSRFFFHKY